MLFLAAFNVQYSTAISSNSRINQERVVKEVFRCWQRKMFLSKDTTAYDRFRAPHAFLVTMRC